MKWFLEFLVIMHRRRGRRHGTRLIANVRSCNTGTRYDLCNFKYFKRISRLRCKRKARGRSGRKYVLTHLCVSRTRVVNVPAVICWDSLRQRITGPRRTSLRPNHFPDCIYNSIKPYRKIRKIALIVYCRIRTFKQSVFRTYI